MTARILALGLALSVAAPALSAEIVIDLWSRADRSGPLRAQNIVDAAGTLNRMLAAAGADERVRVNLIETNAQGFDADALDLLRAHSVGETPDIVIAAHEWIGAFAEAGLAANLGDHVDANAVFYADVIPGLWESVKYKGAIYGIPQDSEVRMMFMNNDILRKMGKSEAWIADLPGAVNSGAFTAWDYCDLAAEAVSSGAAEVGWVHRPNVGPDFQMLMAAFGIRIHDAETARLQITAKGIERFYGWLKHCVDTGALPADITSWTWDSVHAAFREGRALSQFHGIWNVGAHQQAFGLSPTDQEGFFRQFTWINAPAAEKGGRPANLSHPIVYVVGDTPNRDVAAMLVALASQHVPNTAHAVDSFHTPIAFGQSAMPDFVERGWALVAGVPLLEFAQYMPNHARIGQYNAIIYQGIQAVETGAMSPAEAAAFVVEELEVELGDAVVILE